MTQQCFYPCHLLMNATAGFGMSICSLCIIVCEQSEFVSLDMQDFGEVDELS